MMCGKRILAALVGTFALSVLAAPTVNDLKVTAIPPWGLALDYTVEGATAADVDRLLYVTVTDGAKTCFARNLVGATNCVNGAHRVYWNLAADGLTATVTNGTVTAGYGVYCVINVSAGSSATSYPVSYLAAEPSGGWTDEYKTSKIVLRRIYMPSGTSYYAGVFEITEAQWARVMGGSNTSTKPKGSVSYNEIRGAAGTYDWPKSDEVSSTSFMGRLRQKTGLTTLDLPSEEEWEYAARAGVTTKWICGNGETGLGDYAWYKTNSGEATHSVGTRRANAWGLYDVHGNVWECCLDRYSSGDNNRRVLRGGAYDSDVSPCAFAYRHYPQDLWIRGVGFRLFCRPRSK